VDFDQWIKIGIENSWCGPPVCHTHDGFPTSQYEDEMTYDQGSDLCLHMVRLYEDSFHREEIEAYHSESVWRGDIYK
jgi:hypothetical protein